jgi:hypothetical protein
VAGAAGAFAHEAGEQGRIRLFRFQVLGQKAEEPFVGRALAIEEASALAFGELLERLLPGRCVPARQRQNGFPQGSAQGFECRGERIAERLLGVGDEELGFEAQEASDAAAIFARPLPAVEREQTGIEGLVTDAATSTVEPLAEDPVLGVLLVAADDQGAAAEAQGGGDEVRETRRRLAVDGERSEDDVDVVLAVARQGRSRLQRADGAVDAGPREAELAYRPEQIRVDALASAHGGGKKGHALATKLPPDPGDDLLPRLGTERPSAVGAMLHPDLGVQQTQVVVDLGDRRHRGFLAAAAQPLLDGDGRRQAGEVVDRGAGHHLDELAGVRRQGVEVAALAFGVQDVEGESRLPRTAQPGDDDEVVAREFQAHVAEIVLVGPDDAHDAAAVGNSGHALALLARPRRCVRGSGLGRFADLLGCQDFAQVACRVRVRRQRHFLGCSGGNDFAAGIAALGAQVDHVIGRLHHFHVVFDDEQRVAALHESLQRIEQLLDVGEVQADGGFVEQEQGVCLCLASHGRRQLQALRLPSGKRVQRLAEAQIVETNVDEDLQAATEFAMIAEEAQRLAGGHAQNVVDGFLLVADLEDLGTEAGAVADTAGYINVGQKLHLDALESFAFAGIAATAVHVEGERGALVAAHARDCRTREQLADEIVRLQVRRRVGAGRRANGGLVDENHVGDAVGTVDRLVLSRRAHGLTQLLLQGSVQHILDQGRLPGPGDARDAHET